MSKNFPRPFFPALLFAVSLTRFSPFLYAEELPAPKSRATLIDPGPAGPATQGPAGSGTQNVSPSPIHRSLAYRQVAANLDPDGVLYFFWNAEKAIGALDQKLESVEDMAVADPSLSLDEKAELRKDFDLGIRLLLQSGLQEMRAFGFSSRELEPGLFLNKTYTYLPERFGFLWDSLGKAPHGFQFLKMIPENTEGFAFFDFDLGLLWRAVFKELADSDIPEVVEWQQRFSQKVRAFTGLGLDDLLGSLGDQIGIIVTLNPKTMVKIPLGTEQYEMPEPAAAFLWKVRNDKLFDRLEALLSTSSKVAKVDEPDLRMRVLEGSEAMPYLTPTLARSGEYMIISSSETLVRAMRNAESGKTPGISSSSEFNSLAAGMPEQGNSVAYVAKRLQKTLADLQLRLSPMRESANPLMEAMAAKFSRLSENSAAYIVSGATEDGWLATEKTTKDLNEVVGELLTIPAYYLAGIGIDQLKQARANDALAQIKRHLATLRTAKDEAIAEKNLKEGRMMNKQDIDEYIREWPQSVVGEVYEIGTVGQPPYATAPVDLGNYHAGSKIEP
ncbi:MAG: hypothetical protein JOZ60_06870 [Verrucomicrobia bacterium]|nr:hypothetical protein [Verrucomicrobiota bacterium]